METINISDCPKLDLANNLDNVTEVTRSLVVGHHDISFVNDISTIGSLTVYGNDHLTDLREFTSLNNFMADVLILRDLSELVSLDLFEGLLPSLSILELINNPLLSDLSALNEQTEIFWIMLGSCPSLENLRDFSNLRSTDIIGISDLDGLVDLEGLNKLTSCISMQLSENEKLVSLQGLENLSEVLQFGIIENNNLLNLDNLLSVSALKEESNIGGKLIIRKNEKLNSIIGLQPIFGCPNSIIIEDNPELSICHIQLVCNALQDNCEADVEIQNNAIGCNSPDEILEQCYDPVVQKIFFDQDESALDENEYGLPIGSSLYNGLYNVFPDNDGLIKFVPLDGSIDLEYQAPEYWETTTNDIYFFPSSENLDTIKTGIIATEEIVDLRMYLAFTPLICDQYYKLTLALKNYGTTILQVNSKLNAVGDFLNSNPVPSNIDGESIFHTTEVLLPGQVKEINLYYESPNVIDLPLGATVFHDLFYEVMDEAGTLLYNDEKAYPVQFLCAYDPNDKQVFPEGVLDENYTLFDEKELQYLIRFQNTGNYHAEDIIIRDTLDADLDWSTFQFVAASHPISEIRLERNALAFVFENIFLPDSISNEPGSHGFVSYTIETKEDLAEKTEIENTAHIYFDSNPAIVTNTTLNTMVSKLPGSSTLELEVQNNFSLYPNPANDQITIKLSKEMAESKWQIYSVQGELLDEGILNSDLAIDIDHLNSGIYLMYLGQEVQKFVVE